MEILRRIFRKKNISTVLDEKTRLLKKHMTLRDLIALGVGSTIGVGIYILTGSVAKSIAGPAAIISFFLAATVSALAGMCYIEFGSRAPTSGSVYTYCYIAFGEFIAFTVGWALISEYAIGTASVAKALSLYIDSLLNNAIENYLRNIYETDSEFFSEYFDVLAFAICILFAVGLAFGVKESVNLNTIVTTANLSIVFSFIVIASFYINFENWMLPAESVPKGAGSGGFFPYGFDGVIRGASTCFYGFIGFDCIATTGEEIKNPQRSLPIAIIISLSITFTAYFGVSSLLTLILPYYLQDTLQPLPYAISKNGLTWAKWIFTLGPFLGLFASLLGAFFPISRLVYAMANDGLLFRQLGVVSEKYNTPFVATILCGTITGIIAGGFNIDQLIDLNSIGTLFPYSMIAACVILLRYEDTKDEKCFIENKHNIIIDRENGLNDELVVLVNSSTDEPCPTSLTKNVVIVNLSLFCICSITLCFLFKFAYDSFGVTIICLVLLVAMTLQLLCISKQPMKNENIPFKMPFVPLLPALSIFFNILLITQFDFYTWLRFIVWICSGYFIYFGYGIFHSKEN